MKGQRRTRKGSGSTPPVGPSESPLAKFLGPDHPSVAELAPAHPEVPTQRRRHGQERQGAAGVASESRPSTWRRARRRVLGAALLVALTALVLLNTVGLAARWASPKLSLGAGGVLSAVERLVAGNEVRVLRPSFVRTLANRLAGPVRVGLQVGHLDAALQPDELADLRYSTGAHASGFDEVDVNLAVVEALAARLAGRGIEVDVLPATIPAGYSADLVLAVHADSSLDPQRSGYKSAHFLPARNPREALLKVAIDRAMFQATRMADDDRNVSGNMLHYYAFNSARFRHSVAARTPALLVELGYLSNASDLKLLTQPDLLAAALEYGVLGYLSDIYRW